MSSVNNSNRSNYGRLTNGQPLMCSLFWCLLTFCCVTLCNGSQRSIHVDSNSYKDIVISFDPVIAKTLVSTLLDNVEEKIQLVSDALYTATNQSLCFGEVILLIPDSWSDKIGNRRLNTTRSYTALDSDFYIHSKGDMFNEEPYTSQFGQCGAGGKLITISKDVFLAKETNHGGGTFETNGIGGSEPEFLSPSSTAPSTSSSTLSSVKSILNQWASYRYGVFSEHGYRSDKFHPDYTQDNLNRLLLTSCASNPQGESLDISVTPLTPTFDCLSRPLSDSFPPTNSCGLSTPPSNIVSSLMFSPRLSSISTFCSEETHDAFSPTKQNRLCDGKSINQIIHSHPDFRRLQLNNGNKCSTKFTVVAEKRPRIAVFFDSIKGYDDYMILDPIRALLHQYNPLILQLEPRNVSILKGRPIIRGHEEEESVCFGCAMEQIRGNVKNVEDSVTHLYILTSGNFRNDPFPLESYAKELLSYDIKVKIVIYPYKPEANYTSLMRFAQAASAELSVIPHIDRQMPGSTFNRIAFLESLALSRDQLNPTELVVIAKNTTTDTENYSFKFYVDQSLIEANYSIKVILLCHSLDQCAKRIEPKLNVEGEDFVVDAQELFYNLDSLTFTHQPLRHQYGLWTVNWSGLDPNKVSYLAAIAEAPTTRRGPLSPALDSNLFSGSCWISVKEPIISPTSRDRVFAYVSLTKKLHEYVHNASVSIAFYDEFGGLLSVAPMVDDGLGDPDITRGDGVWSYLLSDLPTGRFIRAEAIVASGRFTLYPGLMDRPCCGSSVPEQPVVQSYTSFNRAVSCGTFYLHDSSPSGKFLRTSRTFDLSVRLVDRFLVEVEFSIPPGIESIEDIKIFNWTERPFIRSAFDSYGVRLISDSDQGLDKFSKQITIPSEAITVSGPYVIAVQLRDSQGSKVLSNLVNVYLNGEPELPSELPESSSDSYSSDLLDKFNSAVTGSRRSLFGDTGVLGIWHVTSIVVGSFLFILIILLFIICLVAGRKRRGSGSGHHRHSNGSNGSINGKDESKKKLPASLGTENPDKSVYRSYSDGLMGVKSDDVTDLSHHHHHIHSHSHMTANLNMSHSQSPIQQQLHSPSQLANQPTYQNNPPIIGNNVKGISPVDSIPANKLLSHYDKVQHAKQRNEPLPVMRIEDITDMGSKHNAPSLSDNDSHFGGSLTGLPNDHYIGMANDLNTWRYPTPVVDQYQYCYTTHASYVPSNTDHLPNNIIEWRNSYEGSETISDYDPRYGTVDKSTTAVSQV